MKRVKVTEAPVMELPFGYVDEEGKVWKNFAVRPMTGRIREQVAQQTKGRLPIELIHTAIQLITSRLGPYDNPPREVITSLTAADRDHILFVARLLDDPEEEQVNPCSSCGVKIEFSGNLATDTELRLPEKDEFTLLKDASGAYRWTYIHKDPRSKVESAQMRLLTAADEEEAFRAGEKSKKTFGVVNHFIAAAIMDLNGKGGITPSGVEDLETKIIDSLRARIEENGFGPDPEFEVACHNCENEESFVVDTISRFLGVGRPKGKRNSGR